MSSSQSDRYLTHGVATRRARGGWHNHCRPITNHLGELELNMLAALPPASYSLIMSIKIVFNSGSKKSRSYKSYIFIVSLLKYNLGKLAQSKSAVPHGKRFVNPQVFSPV